MVYRGKPSLGCKKCRQRKIKCDERPGTCLRCAEKDFVCPGYENPLDRVFQDETAAVQVKSQKAKAKAIIAREEREKDAHAKAKARLLEQQLTIPLLSPLIDQGIAYFMSQYALGLEQPPMHSEAYNKHLSTFGFHPIIATSMTALGLAGVANLCMDPGLKREATRWYSKALTMTNKALASPADVKSDNTLFATILLSVFESTNNEATLMGWVNHVEGSASLIRLRGKAQFDTPVGRRMYLQTVGTLSLKCLGEGNALPSFIHDLNSEVIKWIDPKDPGSRFYRLHMAAADFRAQVLWGKFTSLHDIVDRALEIDDTAKCIFEDVDGDWMYTVERCAQGTRGVFGSYYLIYPSLAAAQTWNWVFYNRIFILDIIRNSLIAGLSTAPPVFVGARYTRLLEESTLDLYKMQADIMASMPQHLHDTPKVAITGTVVSDATVDKGASASASTTAPSQAPSRTFHSPSTSLATMSTTPNQKFFTSNFLPTRLPSAHTPAAMHPATPRDRLPIIRVSGGYSSLFSLYIAGATPIASPQSQEYILHTFERIAAEFGINQAKVLSKALQIKIGLDRAGWVGLEGQRKEGAWDVVPDYFPGVGP